MTTTLKKPKTGGEIDSYCTKCKLDLGHRIIAMVGDTVKKVECRTCGSHHLYRKPQSERVAAAKIGIRTPAAATKKPSTSRSARVTAAERAEREQTATWESAIAGQPSGAFKPYRVSNVFGLGELVRHPKFGDGVVSRVIDRGKVEVLFKDGLRTMAQGQV